MADLDKAVIARLQKGKAVFEIFVDCDKALAFKAGKAKIEDAVATDQIYMDVRKNVTVSEQALMATFGTDNPLEVAAIIIKEGEVQLTTDRKNKMRDELKKRIVELIRKNAVDSRTGLPHPAERIERALDQKHVKINESKSAEQQMNDVAKEINDLLPIKFETRELSVKVSGSYAGKALGVLKALGKVMRSDWQSDGSLLAMVEIPAGMQPDFEDQINKMAHGNAEIKVVNRR